MYRISLMFLYARYYVILTSEYASLLGMSDRDITFCYTKDATQATLFDKKSALFVQKELGEGCIIEKV